MGYIHLLVTDEEMCPSFGNIKHESFRICNLLPPPPHPPSLPSPHKHPQRHTMPRRDITQSRKNHASRELLPGRFVEDQLKPAHDGTHFCPRYCVHILFIFFEVYNMSYPLWGLLSDAGYVIPTAPQKCVSS